jgi:inorganic triphosphatase YgiF
VSVAERSARPRTRRRHPGGQSPPHVRGNHDEIEWQFDVDDHGRVERWFRGRARTGSFALGRARVEMLADTYFDTPDGRVRRAGYALRVRRTSRGAEVTLKSLAAKSADGRARRREISESLGTADVRRLGRGDGPVARRVRAITGPLPLRTLFKVRTRRRTLPLQSVDGVRAAEIAFDTVAVAPGSKARPLRFLRVEVEVVAGPVVAVAAVVAELRRACDLAPARRSKYEIGLAACGSRGAIRVARRSAKLRRRPIRPRR